MLLNIFFMFINSKHIFFAFLDIKNMYLHIKSMYFSHEKST